MKLSRHRNRSSRAPAICEPVERRLLLTRAVESIECFAYTGLEQTGTDTAHADPAAASGLHPSIPPAAAATGPALFSVPAGGATTVEAAALPSTSVAFNIQGSGWQQVDFTDGSHQRIDYSLTANLTLTALPYAKAGDQFDYYVTRKQGPVHFAGTAIDTYDNSTLQFDNTFNYDQVTDGSGTNLVYSSSLHRIIAAYFGLVTGTSQASRPSYVNYVWNGTSQNTEMTIYLPSGWYFDNLYDAPGGTVTMALPSVKGQVFADTNGNGQHDTGEAGQNGVPVFADYSGTGVPTSLDPATTTDASGNYVLDLPWPGNWRIREVPPTGSAMTLPAAGYYDVTLGVAQSALGKGFGNAGVTDADLERLAKGVVYKTAWKRDDAVQVLNYHVDHVFPGAGNDGFYALGLKSTATAPPILAIRGTANIWGVLDDLNPQGVGYAQFINNRGEVESWLTQVSVDGATPYITGHSLGGALAQWFAADYTAQPGNQPLGNIVTFNSPGIAAAPGAGTIVGASSFQVGEAAGVRDYVADGDIVSMAGWAYIPGSWYLSSFSTGAYNPVTILAEKHLSPLVAPTIAGWTTADWAYTTRLGGDPTAKGSTSTLSKAAFEYGDREYKLILLGAEMATKLIALFSRVDFTLIPAALRFRGTTEAARLTFGAALHSILGAWHLMENAVRATLALGTAPADAAAARAVQESPTGIADALRLDVGQIDVDTVSGSPDTLRFTGELGLRLQAAAVGSPVVSMAALDPNGVFDADHLGVSGDFSLSGGAIGMTGSGNLNWADPSLALSGDLSGGSGTASGTAALTIDSDLQFAAGAAINVNGGTCVLGADLQQPQLVVRVSSGNVVFDASQHLAALLLSGGTAAVSAGRNLTLQLDQLNLTGAASFDLAGNNLIVGYTGVSPVQTVRQWIGAGRLGVTPAIKSSAGGSALGFVDNALIHQSSFFGQPLTGFGQILIRSTPAGDTNLDGKVDQRDYVSIIANLGRRGAQWFLGDVNDDGLVTADDLAEVTANLGAGAASAAGPAAQAVGLAATDRAKPASHVAAKKSVVTRVARASHARRPQARAKKQK